MSEISMVHVEDLLGLCREMFLDLSETLFSAKEALFPTRAHIRSLNQKWFRANAVRDFEKLEKLTKLKGIEILTVTLPELGKWLDQCLESGGFSDTYPHGCALCCTSGFVKSNLILPDFLCSFWMLLDEYFALDHPLEPGDEEQFCLAIRQARSLLYCFYKLEVPFSESQREKAIAAFIATDDDCGVLWSRLAQELVQDVSALLRRCLMGFDPYDIEPRHGPGAVATGEKLEEKWVFKRLYSSLNQFYPYVEYMYGVRENGRRILLAAHAGQYRCMVKDEVPTSKLVLVPKDSRGPRTICSEPLEIQFIQQGIARALVRFITGNTWTKGLVGFEDQTVNGRLALHSSRDRKLATLDLKDASDLVSLELFKAVWPDNLVGPFLAARSTHVRLPDGSVRPLKKFAPMGSALCFPVEAMIFWALCVVSIAKATDTPFSVARQSVHVYGDDLIVPVEHVAAVIGALEEVGLKVNHSKCCYRSYFRESCGIDAYKGHLVTPQRIRKLPGQGPSDGLAHVAWLAYASHYHSMKMERCGMYCHKLVERSLGYIPVTDRPERYLSVVNPSSPDPLCVYPRSRWNARYQLAEAELWVVSTKRRPTVLTPWQRLHRDLLSPVESCSPDEVVVPNATKIAKRWCLVYQH